MRSSFEGGGLAQTRQMNILLYFLIRMAIQNFNAEEASEPKRTYIIKYSTYAVLPQNNFSYQIRAHRKGVGVPNTPENDNAIYEH